MPKKPLFTVAQQDMFVACAKDFGLQPTDLGRVFTFKGRRYRIAGMMEHTRVEPIICIDLQDQKVRFRERVVRDCLALEAAQ